MIAQIPQPDNRERGLCGAVLLGIDPPPGTERCVLCLDLDDLGDFREEDWRVVALDGVVDPACR
jgi:hypothetical protein